MPVDSPRRRTNRDRLAARRAAEAAERARVERRRRTGIGVVAALLVVLAVVVVIVVQTRRTDSSAAAATPAGTAEQGTAVVVGRPDAPVAVDVYADFQCPVCARFEATNGETLGNLVDDGQIALRYRPMAFLDRASTTDYSTRALNAAAVVLDSAGPEAFVAFHDLLFADQPEEGTAGLTDDQLIGYAEQAGATGPEVAAGIRDRTFEDWTARVTEEASKAGITGTPTVLVDGEVLDPAELTPDGLTSAVAAAAG